MIHVLTIIFLMVSIPAWGIVLGKEYYRGKKFKAERERGEQTREYWMEQLVPTEQTAERLRAEFDALFPKMPYALFSRRAVFDSDPELLAWFAPIKDRLFNEYGLAEDFRAIYGSTWEEDAQFLPSTMLGEGFRWNLKGFHNSPCGEKLTNRWPERRAVEALLWSKRGYVPVYKGEWNEDPLHINVFPYAHTDWNGKTGAAWYRRITENLRRAGKPVTPYFITRKTPNQSEDGVYYWPAAWTTPGE